MDYLIHKIKGLSVLFFFCVDNKIEEAYNVDIYVNEGGFNDCI